MTTLPKDPAFDSTLALMNEPYRFIGQKVLEHKSDVFQIRVMGSKLICMMGEEASKLFYNELLFTRKGAIPEPLKATLIGKGGVQELEGDEHRHRKAMILSLMTEGRVEILDLLVRERLQAVAAGWEMKGGEIHLYSEIKKILLECVCKWAGVPLTLSELDERVHDLALLFESAASLSKHAQVRFARKKSEAWIMSLVDSVREGRFPSTAQNALTVVSLHRDLKGNLLDRRVAAVEILNVLRPVMAVAVFIIKGIHALHTQPHSKFYLMEGGDQELDHFVQEVRRFYPFFPGQMAKVARDFTWKHVQFKKGTRVMLDFYGTDRDPRIWKMPNEFLPQRFAFKEMSLFNFIPQGGGDPETKHRCPGIPITIKLMKTFVNFFVRNLTYDVPSQDLSIDFHNPPALVKSGMVVKNVEILERDNWELFAEVHESIQSEWR